MIKCVPGVLAALVFSAALASSATAAPGVASPSPIVVAQAATPGETARRARKRSEARSRKEPTARQMATRERQRKCAAEWKSAKAAGTTAGAKWPKFWSTCNARLKGDSA